jgi:alpha-1,3-rhamnosyltransferase
MTKQECNIPLVSVIVLSFNSSSFIVETLNSIKLQTYNHLELIITDDFSSDDTVTKVNEWLSDKKNIDKFQRVEFVINQKNQGISGNCNIGLNASKGQWLKFIAGDDILYPKCIELFVNYSLQNPDSKFLISKLNYFYNKSDAPIAIWPKKVFPLTNYKQFKQQIIGGFIKAPAVFMNRYLLIELGGFNENYPFLEDDPLWIKFLYNGHCFHLVPNFLVGYRLHNNAISNGRANGYINPLFFDSIKRFKRDIIFPLMQNKKMFLWLAISKLEFNIKEKIVNNGNSELTITYIQKMKLLFVRIIRKILNIFDF